MDLLKRSSPCFSRVFRARDDCSTTPGHAKGDFFVFKHKGFLNSSDLGCSDSHLFLERARILAKPSAPQHKIFDHHIQTPSSTPPIVPKVILYALASTRLARGDLVNFGFRALGVSGPASCIFCIPEVLGGE